MSGQSSGEKTEQPTPKKLRDARKKGQVARSQEVATTISLFAVVGLLMVMGGHFYEQMVALMRVAAELAKDPSPSALSGGMAVMFDYFMRIILPVVGITVFAGIVGNMIQFGVLFAFENVMPKLEKVSPSKGFKRIFSMKQVVEVLKSVFKIVFLSLLLYYVVKAAIGPYITSVHCGMPCIMSVTVRMLVLTLGLSAVAFIIVAILDFAYQKHVHIKGLKMTKEEVKREYKESEGDPLVKGMRRQLAHELVMSDMGGQTRKATAVVVNPVHLAVALRYDPVMTPVPMVVAKGRANNALLIRVAAEEAGVPIFRNVALARLLFWETEPGETIPDEAFQVVAELLVWVDRNRDKLYAGPLDHGVIDMDADDHRPAGAAAKPADPPRKGSPGEPLRWTTPTG